MNPSQNNFNGHFQKRTYRNQPYQGRHFNNNYGHSSRSFDNLATGVNVSNEMTNEANYNKNLYGWHNDSDSIKRLKEIKLLPFMERRNLKAIMCGNPRFHLVAFNEVPKIVKTSLFLSDLALSVPDIRSRNIISIHCNTNSANPNNVDYLIGFNSTKIIKRIKDIFGTGYVDLYKSNVQVVIPDLEDTKQCEYNRVVTEELTLNKEPYVLKHDESSLISMVEMLEKICDDKFFYITAICCVGYETYINVNRSNLILNLTNAAQQFGYSIDNCDTIALTGSIPSELLPQCDADTPLNASQTAKLSIEEIIKNNGFKSLYEKYEKDQKNQEVNLIKRSLRELERSVHSTLNRVEGRIEEKLNPLELKLNLGFNRLEEILTRVEMELEISQQNSNSATTSKARHSKKSTPVNPPTSGRTGSGKEKATKTLVDEIDKALED